MVDRGTYYKKEKTERIEKTLPANKKQWIVTGVPQKHILRGKIKISNNNKKGKTKILERILQPDTMHKSMERSVQVGTKQNK
jgi:hypothetical protein